MDPDGRVALAEIKGDVKLVLAGQERTHGDIVAINKRLDTQDGRLRILESDKNTRDGERKGVSVSSHVLGWIISALVGSGGVIALMELVK